ncbi:CPBP family intramembrane metalloprotease [Oscillatoriales cyanobacterium LEGE 11467]|uniref:CPBP family intramembrane metalloprotease n=1 Tax=Zarconia navalis LEGE 11467 TaxID=1828826 RepID=A0A928VU85_9CYAN|nr:CPBP family intramembrane glutamic endopeptidase [Zarconia navalis]MBE9040251.1 CPBP family intramembrane metalloprotease [Zarconia navalis LEGE 11467]
METLIPLSPVARLLEGERSAFIKVAVFLGVWLGFWLPLAIPLMIQSQWRPFQPLKWEQKLPLLASLYLLVPLVVLAISPAGFASYSSYGSIGKWIVWLEANVGFLAAVSGLVVLFSIERSLGWVEWKLSPHLLEKIDDLDSDSALFLPRVLVPALLPILGLAVWIGGTEEFIFRGILLDLFWQDYSVWLSAAIVSLIFALLHLVWEVKETLPQLPGLWLMGMVLTLARIGDGGSLGLAVGLHAGWIWGISSFDTVLSARYTDKVPPWITGIAAKPLAGILGVGVLIATGVILALINARFPTDIW